jgi:MtfA peptidase
VTHGSEIAAVAWLSRQLQHLFNAVTPRSRRRAAVLSITFPPGWRESLQRHCDHYRRLPQVLRPEFERKVQLFVAERRITGIGIDASDELKLLVAASAVTLSLGWPDYNWEDVGEVLLYPDSFDRDYAVGPGEDHWAGTAHPWGTVILSAPALRMSFERTGDGYHVGIHEFAHIVDVDATRFDGVPSWLTDKQIASWEQIRDREMQRLQQGDSILDAYGAYYPVEFMAVAMETFFERPQELRHGHGQLYGILADYFRQDPAQWDDDRAISFPPRPAGAAHPDR